MNETSKKITFNFRYTIWYILKLDMEYPGPNLLSTFFIFSSQIKGYVFFQEQNGSLKKF